MISTLVAGSFILALAGLGLAGMASFFFWVSIVVVLFLFLLNQIGGDGLSFSMASFFFIFTILSFVAQIVDYIKYKKHDNRYIMLLRESANSKLKVKSLFFGSITLYLISVSLYFYSAGGLAGVMSSWVNIATSRNAGEIVAVNLSVVLYLVAIFQALLICFFSKGNKLSGLLLIIAFGIIYGLIFRAKSMLLPVILPLAALWYFNSESRLLIKVIKLALAGVVVILLYFLFTAFRWAGELDSLSYYSFVDSLRASLEAGFERNLIMQARTVFEYFQYHNSLLGGAYTKAFLLPLSFLNDFKFVNPMYVYFSVVGGADGVMRGSAHPTIFVDSYAAFKWLGVAVGASWIFVLRFIFIRLRNLSFYSGIYFLVISSYSIPLIVRGSVYYGMLYFVFAVIGFYVLHLILFRLRLGGRN